MEQNTSKAYAGAVAPPNVLLTADGEGSSLFVINLCASIAPVQLSGKTLPGFESYRLYQVARIEDGRTRHRLRLGFFGSASEADGVLASVRQLYPTAFTACLCDEDRKFARGYAPAVAPTAAVSKPTAVASTTKATVTSSKVAATQPAAAQPAPTQNRPITAQPAKVQTPEPKTSAATKAASVEPETIELTWEPAPAPVIATRTTAPAEQEIELSWDPPQLQPTASAPSDKSATLPPSFQTQPVIKAQPQPAASKPQAKPAMPAPQGKRDEIKLSVNPNAAELTLATDAAPVVAAKSQPASTQPFHVAKGVEIPAVALSLATDAKAAAPAPVASPPQAIDRAPAKTPAMAKAAPAKAAMPTMPATPAAVRNPNAKLPDLDSTQTIRALTSSELSDDSQEKWFAIQLAVSDQPVNLDAMPHLDIFEAYRLYSVATAGSGKIVHSLRLGFFREAVSAEAVNGYLKTFFGSPSVLRISAAEQLRFKDPPTRKAPTGEAKQEAKVVELRARSAKPAVPTVTVEVTPKLDTSATGSFKPNATGSFKANSTGSFKANSTGSFKAHNTGAFTATGSHAAMKSAAKTEVAARSESASRSGTTGKYKAGRKVSLEEQLLEEAREVELSESGIRKLPKNDSLLARLVGKLTK